jgi:acetolactate synthase-1/2/3 large subunit
VVGATPETGVEFPDFVAVAKAYRVRSVAIRGEADLAELDRWLTENGPLLIDIEVDPRQEFAPRIKSRVDEHGKFVTPELDDMHPFLPPEELEMARQEAERIEHLSVLDDREGR